MLLDTDMYVEKFLHWKIVHPDGSICDW